MINLGNKDTTLYLDNKMVTAAYLGSTKVYPNTSDSLSLSASSLSFAAAGQSQNLTINVQDGQAWTLDIPSGSKFSANVTSGTGTTTISISVGNNTTESVQGSTLTVFSAGLTATCDCTQPAGVQIIEYGDWMTLSVSTLASPDSVPASGGSVTLTSKAHQERSKTTKWNGIVTNTETESQDLDVTESTIFFEFDIYEPISGNIVEISNNTSDSEKSYSYGGRYSGSDSPKVTIVQAAGVQSTEYTSWVTNSVTISANTTSVAAAGGSATLSTKASQTRSKITKWNGIETGRTTESQTPDVSTSATYSKVSGSGSVSGRTVSFPNNTSTSALSGVYRAAYSGKTSDVTISQTAGAKVYGAWRNTSIHTDTTTFTAVGGRTNAYVNVARDWTWNGVAGSGGTETNTADLASASGSPTWIVAGARYLECPSLGTIVRDKTAYTITSQSSLATNPVSIILTQESNYVSGINLLLTRTFSYSTIPAGGGTLTPTWNDIWGGNLDNLWQPKYASGATSLYSYAVNAGYGSVKGVPAGEGGYDHPFDYSYDNGGNFTGINRDTGAITASSKGITVSGVTTTNVKCVLTQKWVNNTGIGPATIYFNASKGGYATGTCSQAANAVTGYGTPIGRTLSVADIPAKGGSISSGTLGGTITQSRTYTSGGSDTVTNPTVSASSYSSAVSASSKGTTVSSRNSVGTLTYYYTCNGKQGSASATVYQAANAKTSITYGTPSVKITSVADIPASGGTRNSGSCTYSQARTQNYTSGATSALSALTSGGSVSWSSVTASSKGSTISPRSSAGTITCTVSMNGKSGSATATVYQAANYLTAVSVTLSSFSYSVAPAAAGNSTPTQTGSDSLTFTFSSGTSSSSSSGIGTYYTASSSGSYSWGGAAGFFNSLNTSTGVVSTTTAGTTPINSQLAGPTVTKKVSMTYTPKSSLGAGSTVTGTGTKTAAPQKGTNTRSVKSSGCVSGTTKLSTTYVWTSGATEGPYLSDSYACGYRVRKNISVSINQSGVLPQLTFSQLRAYACWGSTIQYQGDSYVDFNNPNLGENTATLTLNQSETNNHSSIPYVLIQLSATYNDGQPGAYPTYTWTGDVTSSGSLAIYSASGSGAVQAQCQLGPSTRSLSLQEDAENLLQQTEDTENVANDASALLAKIEEENIEVSEDIKNQLQILSKEI